jgi:hypothetical protein
MLTILLRYLYSIRLYDSSKAIIQLGLVGLCFFGGVGTGIVLAQITGSAPVGAIEVAQSTNALPDFSADPLLKPLVDRSGEKPSEDIPSSYSPGQNTATSKPQAPKMLTGRVESIENAMQIEQGEVDWYDWYLSARNYLAEMGGLDCLPGTPIKFHRTGTIEAQSQDMICQLSVREKFFPLPEMTQLEAVILPVRRKVVPPATRDELYSNIRRSEF